MNWGHLVLLQMVRECPARAHSRHKPGLVHAASANERRHVSEIDKQRGRRKDATHRRKASSAGRNSWNRAWPSICGTTATGANEFRTSSQRRETLKWFRRWLTDQSGVAVRIGRHVVFRHLCSTQDSKNDSEKGEHTSQQRRQGSAEQQSRPLTSRDQSALHVVRNGGGDVQNQLIRLEVGRHACKNATATIVCLRTWLRAKPAVQLRAHRTL
jgi:hypothetical protein